MREFTLRRHRIVRRECGTNTTWKRKAPTAERWEDARRDCLGAVARAFRLLTDLWVVLFLRRRDNSIQFACQVGRASVVWVQTIDFMAEKTSSCRWRCQRCRVEAAETLRNIGLATFCWRLALGGSADSQLFHPGFERRGLQSQQLSRAAVPTYAPLGARQHLCDVVALDHPQRATCHRFLS